MKKAKTLVRLAALTAVLAVPLVTQAASIVGSRHDLSSANTANTYRGTNDQTCVYCHTPHNASSTVVALWNKTMTAQTFQPYASPTLQSSVTATIGGVSLACLTCHDGTLAVDAYTGSPSANAATHLITGASLIGTDLRNDHPISFTYDGTGNGPGIKTPPATLPRYGTGANQMECATCHNVHDNAVVPFLRASNAQSALCLQCHSK